MYWNVSNFNEWAMSQKLPVDSFKWRKDLVRFDKEITLDYDEDSDKETYLKLILSISSSCTIYIVISQFYPLERK